MRERKGLGGCKRSLSVGDKSLVVKLPPVACPNPPPLPNCPFPLSRWVDTPTLHSQLKSLDLYINEVGHGGAFSHIQSMQARPCLTNRSLPLDSCSLLDGSPSANRVQQRCRTALAKMTGPSILTRLRLRLVHQTHVKQKGTAVRRRLCRAGVFGCGAGVGGCGQGLLAVWQRLDLWGRG